MHQITKAFTLKVFIFSLILFITSCNNTKEAPPFPYHENEYAQPQTKSFEFSKPDTLQWVTSKLKALPKTKFSWNKLPSKPLDIGLPYKLKKPLTSKPFNWDSLPSTPFSLENLPKKDLKIKISVLGDPKIVKANNPVINSLFSPGVMQLDANFGLPGINYCSTKDKDGMLWFGTSNGIARYDSENIEIYGSEQGLNATRVFSLIFDSKNRLWVSDNSSSIFIIDFEVKLIYQLTTKDPLDVYGMFEDDQSRMWFANRDFGYIIFDLNENWSRQFKPKNGLLGTFTIDPFQDSGGRIWLSSGGGCNILDLKSGKNITLTQDQGLMQNFVSSFYEDREGKIWISGGGGINILSKDKTEMSYFTPNEGLDGIGGAADIFQDKYDNFWIGSVNGLLFSYDEPNKILEKYKLSNNNSQFVFNLLEDNQGQIWASIAQGGLFKIDVNSGKTGNFTKANGLTDDSVWRTLVAKDGRVWIGTERGVDVYNPKNETIKHFGIEQGLVADYTYHLSEDSKGRIWVSGNNFGVSIIDPINETIEKLTKTEGLKANSGRYIIEDSNGNYWLGGNPGELHKFDLKNATYQSIAIDTTRTPDQNIVIFEDSKKNIWVGTNSNGLQLIDPASNTRVRLTTDNGLVGDQIMALIEDEQQNIWVATINGVQKIDLKNKVLTTFTTEEGLAANDIYDIILQKGEFFLGSSKGISILTPAINKENKTQWKVRTLDQNQGIMGPDISQNSIDFDKNGRLWAGGNPLRSIMVIDKLVEDTAAYPAVITSINIMDKKRVFKDVNLLQKKRADLDTLWVRNKPYLYNKTAKDSSYLTLNNIQWSTVKGAHNIPVGLTLPYTQNYLSFNFNGGQFANPNNLVYRYILEGIDKNWSPITTETESENYRDLPSGDYTFKVASKGFNEVWSKTTEFKFVITPPWWQSWWAYTIFVALFLGLGLVILHYRSQYLKKENRILEEKVNHRTAKLNKTIEELENTQSQLIHSEKMASLGELTAGIAHEIQNPMNFITNFSEVSMELIDEMHEELDKGDYDEAKTISKDISQNLDKITHHGKRASSIVKGMLEHSRNTSGKKELTDINVLADEYLRLSYHGLRAKNKSFNADFKTDLDESLPKVEVIPQDLGRVLLNLINNAFYAVTSAAEDGQIKDYKPLVTVSTKKLDDQVLITVQDNGTGIPDDIKEKIFQPFFTTKPTGKGTGLGLSLAYDIITQGHGGAIELDTEAGKGTKFSIYIPL